MIKLTTEQTNRVKQAIRETRNLMSKELGYSERFQDKAKIAGYQAHIAKLEAMLQTGAYNE